MIFYKYEALGNDFIITCDVSVSSEQVISMCNRNFGIGADGILIHYDTPDADAGMRIINSDGSVPEMCGNGLRCFASYLILEQGVRSNPVKIKTDTGLLNVMWSKKENGAIEVEANLGEAKFLGEKVIESKEKKLHLFGVSMGNPHIVVTSDNDIEVKDAQKFALQFQENNFLGITVNVEVLTKLDVSKKKLSLIVNERGSGFTLGCGTGGAATVYAVEKKTGTSGFDWSVVFPGGMAQYKILRDGKIVMTGIPNRVFKGII